MAENPQGSPTRFHVTKRREAWYNYKNVLEGQAMTMDSDARTLRDLVRALPLAEGANGTHLSFLTLYRSAAEEIDMPESASLYLYMVVDGTLRLFTPSGILDRAPGQYFLSRIDTPLRGRVQVSASQGDFFAAAVSFSPSDVLSVLLEMDGSLAEEIADGLVGGAAASQADRCVTASLCRLIAGGEGPAGSGFIGRQLRREIIFYALSGSYGQQLLRSAASFQQAGEIYAANRWIKENFRAPLTVEDLAERRNMSVSQFHQKFKSAVGMGPLQCQKRLRLTEARRLMLNENRNVTEAALEVGYESTSQFIREYRKLFGSTPKEEITALKRRLEKQAIFSEE